MVTLGNRGGGDYEVSPKRHNAFQWILNAAADADAQCGHALKVCSHGVAAAAATTAFSCHSSWIPQYLMDSFTLCGSGNCCGNSAASKWVLTLFLWLWQRQTNCFNCYLQRHSFILAFI